MRGGFFDSGQVKAIHPKSDASQTIAEIPQRTRLMKEYSAKLSNTVTELETQLRIKESEIRIHQSSAEINLFQAKLQQKANEELEVKIVALQAEKM